MRRPWKGKGGAHENEQPEGKDACEQPRTVCTVLHNTTPAMARACLRSRRNQLSPHLMLLRHLLRSQFGVALASAGELSFNWTGFLTAMASNLTFGFRAVWSKR